MPGNRVLLRAPNNPMLAACWFAVVKAGGIAVATHAAAARQGADADHRQGAGQPCAVRPAAGRRAETRARPQCRDAARSAVLQRRRRATACEAAHGARSRPPSTTSTPPPTTSALIAFTSGTTGQPKGTMHFHRDVMAVCACWPPHRAAAHAPTTSSSAPRRWPSPSASAACCCSRCASARRPCWSRRRRRPTLLEAIAALSRHGAVHRADRLPRHGAGAGKASRDRSRSLRKCVSAGEALPAATRAAVAARPPASRSSTASARPRCCTSSSRADERRCAPRRHRQGRCPATRPA